MKTSLTLLTVLSLGLAAASRDDTCQLEVAIKGRVVDSTGKGIADAEVQIWRKPQREGKPFENEQIKFDGVESVRTDADGRFVTPVALGLDPDQPIRVIAQADAMLAARSPWVKPGESKSTDVGDIVLRRLRTVTGRVVDREGKPVAEAEAFHSGDAHKVERTRTGADGRFQLPGVPDGRACVFLEKAGFRFTGALLDPSQSEVELVAIRSDERIEPLRTLPQRVPADEQVALARRLLEPYLKAAIESGADIDKNWAISALGRFDPITALELTDRTAWGDGMKRRTRDWVIELMIDGLAPEQVDDAVPYIEASEAAESASTAYIQLARAVPVEDRARRLDYVGRALLQARNSKEPERLVFLAQIAEHLHELGEEDLARRLGDEVFSVAERSSDQVLGWTLGVIPLALAQIDLPRSLALVDRLPNSDYAYRMGMLALRLADKDAAEAERVWNLPLTRSSENTDFLIRRDNRRAARVCTTWRDPTLNGLDESPLESRN